jgi:CheY-like chemotaxis protein
MAKALSGVRVLFLHQHTDDPSGIIGMLETAGGMLETAGAAVRTETSPWLALQTFRAERPDIVISEMGPSEHDDLNLIQRIRASGPRHKWNIPAIALSSHAQPDDHRNAIEAGFSSYLAKPADSEAFVKSITYALTHADKPTA